MTEVVVLNYGLGNVGSITNMLRKLGQEPTVSDEPHLIANAKRLVIGGVGSFDAGVNGLRQRNLDSAIIEAVEQGAKVLGICLGMQLLTNSSEEGVLPGLGLIGGVCKKLTPTSVSRVPNMGWRHLSITQRNSVLGEVEADSRFYFVHSYSVHCDDDGDVSALISPENLVVAAINRENVYGVQFHPEKSHRHGLAVLRGFCSLQ